MPTTVHLSIHLPPTENPMKVELAFRHADNGTSQADLPATERPMTVELTFRHANNGTSQCPLTLYRRSNNAGVSLPTCRQRYISVPTYHLPKIQ